MKWHIDASKLVITDKLVKRIDIWYDTIVILYSINNVRAQLGNIPTYI